MNTLEMMNEVEKNGGTYRLGSMCYNKEFGFHDPTNKKPWEGEAWPTLNCLFHDYKSWKPNNVSFEEAVEAMEKGHRAELNGDLYRLNEIGDLKVLTDYKNESASSLWYIQPYNKKLFCKDWIIR